MQIGPSQSTLQAFGTPLAASEPVRVAAPRASEAAVQALNARDPVVVAPRAEVATGDSSRPVGDPSGSPSGRPGQAVDIIV